MQLRRPNGTQQDATPEQIRDYEEGFRNGHIDTYLGAHSIIAATSPNAYRAMGYRDGASRATRKEG